MRGQELTNPGALELWIVGALGRWKSGRHNPDAGDRNRYKSGAETLAAGDLDAGALQIWFAETWIVGALGR